MTSQLMKKLESEQEIHARLRELAEGARQIRADLSAGARRRAEREGTRNDRPPETRTPKRGKKR